VLIAEKLLLVAVDDKGHVPAGSDAFVKVALTGALLAELAIDGQLTIGNDGTVRTGDTRPGDELLAEVYDVGPGPAIGPAADPASGAGHRCPPSGPGSGAGGGTGRGAGAARCRPDVGAVLALAGPCRLLERVAPDRGTRDEAKKQIARVAAETPSAPGVVKIIDELIAAVAVTATTAAS
jgi:hypothetical protein